MIENTDKKYITQQLLTEIKQRIERHHNLYTNLTVKDKYWEYILAESYRTIGYTVNYGVNSHVSGKDLTVKNLFNDNRNVNISCKAGKVSYSKRLKKIIHLVISSFRTTKYDTLEEKLNFIDSGHEDVVISLSSSLFDKEKKYILTVLVPPKFKNFNWYDKISKKGKFQGYETKSNNFLAKILKKCSYQLWYKIDYNSEYILETYEVCIN